LRLEDFAEVEVSERESDVLSERSGEAYLRLARGVDRQGAVTITVLIAAAIEVKNAEGLALRHHGNAHGVFGLGLTQVSASKNWRRFTAELVKAPTTKRPAITRRERTFGKCGIAPDSNGFNEVPRTCSDADSSGRIGEEDLRMLHDEFVSLCGSKAGLQQVAEFGEECGFASELVHLTMELFESANLLEQIDPAAERENRQADSQVGFYGLDMYSMGASIAAVAG